MTQELPETIYLIDMGNDCHAWSEDPFPDHDTQESDVTKYTRSCSSTRDEKWQYVEKQLKMLQENKVIFDKALEFIDIESQLMQAIFKTEQSFVEALERIVGDHWQWLNWYVYENDYGKNAYEAGHGDNMREIKTLADVRWLLEGCDSE